MDNTNLTQTPPRQSWHQLADEGAALELLEAQDRIRDLQAERDTYAELAKEAIHRVANLTAICERQRKTIAELREAHGVDAPADRIAA